ncbi:FkbM family methyltransferase [Methylobacterium sp. WSM2598]|uniref:FkbM family methyltransferase n=1 Tax=Methylobacterium sp. WSM2598 TaxID=398261 RepID=UPI00037C5DBF|nr:FkbM family methyltransferase [Methylobacterium sp. WSM2598]
MAPTGGPTVRPRGTAAAIGRSLRLYHGPGAPRDAMDALYGRFLRPGDLAFDIGAHVGDRVASFRRLGARVVAVEPQAGPLRALHLLHGRDPGVTLVAAAVAEAEGEVTLAINRRNPTVSSASAEFVAAARGAPGWEGQVWDEAAACPATTLDRLIARHGAPAFVKIDVEGVEDRVLAGLGRPLPALSFEFTTIARGPARRVLDRLDALGPYRVDYSLGEEHRLRLGRFVPVAAMRGILEHLPHEANSGDVYAVLAA